MKKIMKYVESFLAMKTRKNRAKISRFWDIYVYWAKGHCWSTLPLHPRRNKSIKLVYITIILFITTTHYK